MGRPRVVKKFARPVDTNQGKLGDNQTGYHDTYVKHENFIPVKPLKPPPSPPLPRQPPMQSETTTKKSYSAKDLRAKREMIVPVEEHVVSDEPLSNVTVYRNDYLPKSPLPAITVRPKSSSEELSIPKIKFDNRTTNKQSYKSWKPQEKKRFGELPAFTVPLIYPEKRSIAKEKDLYLSRTHTDYPYKTIPKPEMVKVVEGNIKVGEGDRELETTNQAAYQFVEGQAKPATSMRPSRVAKMLALRKMELESKYQSDFPTRSEYPNPPKPKTPAPATLEIKMNNDRVFETEQRKQYHGWDVKVHKRPTLSKLVDNTQLSTDAMQTFTTMTDAYTPKEVSVIRVRAEDRPRTNQNITRGKFQGDTTTKTSFKDWGINARLRHGDFHEAYKRLTFPQKFRAPFDLTTTTKSTFVEKHGRPRTSMKPPQNTIDTSQQHDFTTVARSCYTRICALEDTSAQCISTTSSATEQEKLSYPPASAYEIEDFEIKC